MKDFKKLKIWQKGMDVVKKTYTLAKQLPPEERFGLGIQICKAAVSIPANIAEGSGKRSKKDYLKYLDIALGSSYELETELLVIDMVELGDRVLLKDLLKDVDE